MRIKALPNTKVCVKCSTTGTYRAITTVNGEGDHTWNDIQFLTPEQYAQYEAVNKGKSHPTEFINYDDDGSNLQGPFIIEEFED